MGYMKPLDCFKDMKRDPIKSALAVVTNSVLDGLSEEIQALDLHESDRQKVLGVIEASRQPVGASKARAVSKSPKKSVKEELQCTRLTKSGTKCVGPRCSQVLMSCWGHMTSEEKDAYLKGKGVENETYTIQRGSAAARALEDLENE